MEFYLIRRGNFINPLKIHLNKDEVPIGRFHIKQLQVSDSVSRHHATFKNTNGKWSVIDLRSTNGLFVNGIRSAQCEQVPIKVGDRIGLGINQGHSDEYFEFELCQEREIIILSDDDNISKVRIKTEDFIAKKIDAITNSANIDKSLCKSQHYMTKYASIINSQQPIVLIHRCDSDIIRFSNALEDKQSRKRIQFLETSSEDEASRSNFGECSYVKGVKKKKKVLTVEKSSSKHYYSNVYSSSEASSEEINIINKQANVIKQKKKCKLKKNSNKSLEKSNDHDKLGNDLSSESNSANQLLCKENDYLNTRNVSINPLTFHNEFSKEAKSTDMKTINNLLFKYNDYQNTSNKHNVISKLHCTDSFESMKKYDKSPTNSLNFVNSPAEEQLIESGLIINKKMKLSLNSSESTSEFSTIQHIKGICEKSEIPIGADYASNNMSTDYIITNIKETISPNAHIYKGNMDKKSDSLLIPEEISDIKNLCMLNDIKNSTNVCKVNSVNENNIRENKTLDSMNLNIKSELFEKVENFAQNVIKVQIHDENNSFLPLNSIKPEIQTINTEVKLNKSSDEDDVSDDEGKFLSYSQIDEVIVISDDEDYLSFTSSQEKASNSLNIKVEPLECDDANFEYYDEVSKIKCDMSAKEKQGIDIQIGKNSQNCISVITDDQNDLKNETGSLPDDTIFSENIDAIKEFIKKSIDDGQVEEPQICSKETQSTNCITKEKYVSTDDYFPILSQNFYKQNELTEKTPLHSDRSLHKSGKTGFILSKDQLNLPVHENKKIRLTATTLLTEAKPMQYRARYQRGREEWFQDQYDTKMLANSSKKSHRNCKAENKNVDKVHKVTVKQKKNLCKKISLKSKIHKEMCHRTLISNSESAEQTNLEKKVSKKHLKLHNLEKRPSTSKSLAMNIIRKGNGNKCLKNRLNKQTCRFASRSEFLSKSSEEIGKNKSHQNSKYPFKIPKIKSLIAQNAITNEKLQTNNNEKQIKADTLTSNNQLKCNTNNNKEVFISNKFGTSSTDATAQNVSNFNTGFWLRLSDQQICDKDTKKKPCHFDSNHFIHPHNLIQENLPHLNMTHHYVNSKNTSDTDVYGPITYELADLNKESSICNKVSDPRLHGFKKNKTMFPKEQDSNLKLQRNFDTEERICVVQPSIKSSTSRQVLEKPIRLDFDSVLSNILHWNPSWLKEYKAVIKTPPPCILKNVKCLPLSFNSVNHYVRSFFPFIILELWEYIYKEYHDIQQAGNKIEVNAICIMATECISKGDIMVLQCESLIVPDSSFYPREGNIIIIEVFEENNSCITKLFGYISSVNKQKCNLLSLHHQWKQRYGNKLSDFLFYNFHIKLKKVKFKIALEKLTKAHILCYIANKIRLADGLQYLATAELRNYLLQPSINSAMKNNCITLPPTIIGEYNSNQIHVINSIANEINTTYFKPKLLLLQGPPGTGKTHTITGIVQRLLSDKNVKILITAPSNAAVDEIGRRLITIRKKTKIEIKIVRVGVYSQIHKDMIPYTLEDLTKRYSSKPNKQEIEKLKAELIKKNNLICDLQQQINKITTSMMGNVFELKSKLMMETRRKQSLLEEINRMNSKIVNLNDPAIYSDKLIVLEKANIIMTTLGSCRLKILEKVFGGKSKNRFTCCLVDEAAQCTEPEILQLLAFDVSKLILVGDHKQLPPTVHSQISSKFKYDISLFERIYSYLQEKQIPNPIFMLTEQYRMHSEICSFPSYQFYSNKLSTFLHLDHKYSSFPLKPFIVFNINNSQESNIHSSKKNLFEAEIISEICKQMLYKREFFKYTVGVITPYQGQKDLIMQKFNEKLITNPVTVDTVDRFQGSERDLIILSCVRARSQNGSIGFMECKKRLNVAVTRAKQCLIICGHMSSLERDPIWKALIAYSKRVDHYVTVTAVQDIPFLIEEIKRQGHVCFNK